MFDPLQRLIEEKRKQDGQPHSERDRRPQDFALWLRGMNDGNADAAKRGEPRQGMLT